jgi:hypothetical protein
MFGGLIRPHFIPVKINVQLWKVPLCLGGFVLLISGCVSTIQKAEVNPQFKLKGEIGLTEFENGTQEENAGQTIRDILETILIRRGIAVETIYNPSREATEQIHRSSYDIQSPIFEKARSKKLTHLVTGTIHEFRYKTDLNGNPAVGLTLRVVEVDSGKIVWQATGSYAGPGKSTLTACAQKVLHDVVKQIP